MTDISMYNVKLSASLSYLNKALDLNKVTLRKEERVNKGNMLSDSYLFVGNFVSLCVH